MTYAVFVYLTELPVVWDDGLIDFPLKKRHSTIVLYFFLSTFTCHLRQDNLYMKWQMMWTLIVVICHLFSRHSLTKGSKDNKILSEKYFFKDQHFDLDLWPRDLNINRGHVLSRSIHCIKFGRYWADIFWSTNWPTDHFQEKGKVLHLCKLNSSLQRILWANFVSNWPIGSGEDENLESYRQVNDVQ